MEDCIAIKQLRGVLKGLPDGALSGRDGKESESILKILQKYKKETPHLLWYLVLIADHGERETLEMDYEYGYIFDDDTPSVSLKWLSNIYGIHEKEFSDIISYGPLDIIERLIETMKETLDQKTLSTYCNLRTTLLYKIMRSPISASLLVPHFQYLMKTVLLPVENISQQAESLENVIAMLERALDPVKIPFCKETSDRYYVESLDKDSSTVMTNYDCLEILIETAECLLKDLSVDAWMEFSVFKSASSDRSAQMEIGNTIFRINILIEKNEIKLSGALKSCLLHLQIAPLTHKETLASLPLSELIKQLEIEPDKEMYSELSTREDTWSNLQGRRLIVSLLHLGDKNTLLKYVQNIEMVENENWPEELDTLFDTLEGLDLDTMVSYIILLLEYQKIMDNFPSRIDSITEIFNQLHGDSSQDNDSLKKIVLYGAENPRVILIETLKFAVSGERYHEIAGVLLDIFDQFYRNDLEIFREQVDFRALVNDDDAWRLFGKFMTRFSNTAKYFSLIIEAMIQNAITFLSSEVRRRKNTLTFIREFCIECKDERLLTSIVDSILLLVANVLAINSWDAWSYSHEKADICKEARFLLQFLSDKIAKDPEQYDVSWLRKLAESLPEPIRSTFSFLWTDITQYPEVEKLHVYLLLRIQASPDLRDKLVPVSDASESDVTLALLKILTVIHGSDWRTLFAICRSLLSNSEIQGERAFQAFAVAVTAIATIVSNDSEEIQDCFIHCMTQLTDLFNLCLDSSQISDSLSPNLEDLFFWVVRPVNSVSSLRVKELCIELMIPSLVKCAKSCGIENEKLAGYIHEAVREKFVEALNDLTY